MRPVAIACLLLGASACLSEPVFLGAVDAAAIDATPDAPPGLVTRTLRFDSPGVVANAPILVRLQAPCVDYAIANGGADIRFFSNTVQLAHEVELWNEEGVSLVWVKVPVTAEGEPTEIRFEHGSEVPMRTRQSTEVWSLYEAVWHLNGDANEANSASAMFNGSPMGVDSVAGIAGLARQFEKGVGDRIMFSGTNQLVGGWASLTLEVWVFPDDDDPLPDSVATGNTYLGKGDNQALVDFVFYNNAGALAANKRLDTNAARVLRSDADFTNQQWNYFAVTFNGDNNNDSAAQFFTNGARDNEDQFAADDTLEASDGDFFLGDNFVGLIDEVRIANARFSAGYIELQYAAISNESFVSCE